uniref:PPM-type phosphatase domain-containing protein n=1 Tax=Acrobeloides nanus TaxID=290746 RepID=A0A914DS40_9BILA
MINYHVHRLKAQNLVQYDMMRSFQFEKPQFIDIGFRDLSCTPDRVWRLRHRNFSYCAAQGFLPYQEDRMHYMHDPANGNLSIFSIFDGHGGQFVSEYLEKHFSRRIRERLIFKSPIRKLSTNSCSGLDERYIEAIVTEVHKIDDQISMLDPYKTSYTGSTLISAIFEQNRYLTVVNVGDSRAIACDKNGRVRPLSKDHKPSDTEERQRIENAGGFIQHYGVDRVQGVLAISRAFGDTALKRAHVLTAHPDVVRIDLVKEPLKYLIVASDGFWDVFENQEAIDYANTFLKQNPNRWAHAASELVEAALARNTQDNVSVLFVRLIS